MSTPNPAYVCGITAPVIDWLSVDRVAPVVQIDAPTPILKAVSTMSEVGPAFPTKGVPVIETVGRAMFPCCVRITCCSEIWLVAVVARFVHVGLPVKLYPDTVLTK